MDVKQIISLVVAGIAGLVWAVLEIKRWRSNRLAKKVEKENDLLPNPTRCADHEDRLRKVESVCIEVGPQIRGIEKDVTEIKGDIKSLIDLHLKQ